MNSFEKYLNVINSLISYLYERHAYLNSNRVVLLTPKSESEFESIKTLNNVSIIPNGIKSPIIRPGAKNEIIKLFGIDGNKILCLWIGRDKKRKGLEIALKIAKNNDSIFLFIVGIDVLVQGSKNVIVLGSVKKDELIRLYSGCDVLIFPSIYESMSYTVLEAVSFGLSILSFRTEFMTYIVGDDYPMLCDTEQEMLTVLRRYCTDEYFRYTLKNISKALSKKFTEDMMCNRYHTLYEMMINEI